MGDNSKSKKARVVRLECDRSSSPDLHFYQVSSKYSKGYSSYRVDKKFYANTDADVNADTNKICPQNNISPPTPLMVVVVVCVEVGGDGGADIIKNALSTLFTKNPLLATEKFSIYVNLILLPPLKVLLLKHECMYTRA